MRGICLYWGLLLSLKLTLWCAGVNRWRRGNLCTTLETMGSLKLGQWTICTLVVSAGKRKIRSVDGGKQAYCSAFLVNSLEVPQFHDQYNWSLSIFLAYVIENYTKKFGKGKSDNRDRQRSQYLCFLEYWVFNEMMEPECWKIFLWHVFSYYRCSSYVNFHSWFFTFFSFPL